MIRTSFNTGWTVQPKTSVFAQLNGQDGGPAAVTLPHDAMIAEPRSADAAGGSATGYFPAVVTQYDKSFDVPAEWADRHVILEFEGAYRDAMVYINGAFAGQRPSGYTVFTVDADAFLRFGEQNTIRVETRTYQDSRWYSGAGLYRGVNLLVGARLHVAVDGLRITTPDIDERRAVVAAATTVENRGHHTRTVRLDTVIERAGAEVARESSVVTVLPGESAIARQRLYVARPELWSLDSPSLYTATTTLTNSDGELDRATTRFGIRSLQLDPEAGLRINGEPVKLRGACVHHDNGVIGAATIARAEERRVRLLKQAGFNAIRSTHHPVSRAMLDACDEHGVLVLDETFDMWTVNKSAHDYALAFPEWWERDVESMVAKDFNHPSVVMYSIGNEIPETGTPHGGVWGRRLAEKIRSLDDTRFITNAVNGLLAVLPELQPMLAERTAAQAAEGEGFNEMLSSMGEFMNEVSASDLVTEKTAESMGLLDVAGFNYGDARYDLDREALPNRILLGTETFPGHIDINWKLVTENPRVLGDFTWTGWDYLGESGIGRVQYPAEGPTSFAAPYPWLIAWCGDIDITGHRRPASYYRETVFGLRDEPYIAVQRPERYGSKPMLGNWTWTDTIGSWSWDVEAGTRVLVEVYSAGDEVELLLNGASVGRAPVERFRAEFDLAYEPGELVAVASRDGSVIGTSRLESASGPLLLDVRAEADQVVAGDTDLAYLPIRLVDESGRLYSQRDRAVTVTVSGPGVLQGLGSARPDSAESFLDPTHSTFDGRALAVVRPIGPGEIVVTVSAEECDSATATITAGSPTLSVAPHRVLGRTSPARADGSGVPG